MTRFISSDNLCKELGLMMVQVSLIASVEAA